MKTEGHDRIECESGCRYAVLPSDFAWHSCFVSPYAALAAATIHNTHFPAEPRHWVYRRSTLRSRVWSWLNHNLWPHRWQMVDPHKLMSKSDRITPQLVEEYLASLVELM